MPLISIVVFFIDGYDTSHSKLCQKYAAVLRVSMVRHILKFNTFSSVRIVYPADRHTTQSSAEVISQINKCFAKERITGFAW